MPNFWFVRLARTNSRLRSSFPILPLPDEVIGFHAQQAIEKMLKAALTNSAIRYGRTHDLGSLLDLLRQNNFSFPSDFVEIQQLTPFGAFFRYADLPIQPQPPFNRAWALDMVRRVRTWVESLLAGPDTR